MYLFKQEERSFLCVFQLSPMQYVRTTIQNIENVIGTRFPNDDGSFISIFYTYNRIMKAENSFFFKKKHLVRQNVNPKTRDRPKFLAM